jgi:hypothetical protein
MEHEHIRVFNTETLIRLGLQNSVVRKLRDLGCKVKAASLDAELTISVDPSESFRRRPMAGGILKRRTAEGHQVCIEVDGCRVIWVEGGTA